MPERSNQYGLNDVLAFVHSVRESGQDGLVEAMRQKGTYTAQFELPRIFDLARINRQVTIIGDPKVAHSVLIEHHDELLKQTRDFRILRQFLGDALVPVEGGDKWYDRRRLVLPSFSHQKVISFGN